MAPGYREFEFDLPGALLVRLVDCLDSLEAAPLNLGGLANVPEEQGVYQLFLDGRVVYIGKTDAEAGLQNRLARHSEKIKHRRNLEPARISFQAVRIFVFTAMDLEIQLIRHYTKGEGTPWNGSGFGSNDPGRKRDHSEPGRFHLEYPIDIDRELDARFEGEHTAAQIALRLKEALPYDFRFASAAKGSRRPHPDLEQTQVTISAGARTARAVLTELTTKLPAGWQATALAATLILYPETVDDYPKAEVLARSG